MTPDDVNQLIQAALNNTQYGVAKVPNHTHDGVNSPHVAIQPITSGGTGLGTLGANGVLIGEGTNTVNVTSAGTAGQVLTSNGAGVDPTFQAASPTNTQSTFTATETIAAGAAVASALYQTTNIGYDTSGVNVGTSNSFSTTVTVASNSNRSLAVLIVTQSSISSVTYAGSSIGLGFADTVVGTLHTYQVWGGVLTNPTTGTNALIVNTNASAQLVVYYWSFFNSSSFDTGTGGGVNSSGFSISNTTATDGCVSVGAIAEYFGSGTHGPGTGGGNVYTDNTVGAAGNPATLYGESGVTNLFGTGSVMTFSTSGVGIAGDLMGGVFSIKPFHTPVAGVENASSAANNQRSQGFVGFANASAVAGGSVTVSTTGIVTGLSTIAIGQQYYLNDANGTIGLSVGSVTRKVGIGTSNSSLLITNIW